MKFLTITLVCLFTTCFSQNKKNTSNSKKSTTKEMQMPKKINTIYDFSFEDINGDTYNFADLKGKKILILNTASKCGYTKQYDALEHIYQKYKDDNFLIVGFPSDNFGGQEFENNEEIANFCKLNYGVSFPLMTKSDVIGQNQNEIFKFLTQKKLNGKSDNEVKWNFTKFLINSDGTLEASYPSKITPDDALIIDWIEK